MTTRALRNTLAALLTFCALFWLFVAAAHGQTLGTPVAARTDSTVSGAARVTWPAAYDSSRAVVTVCAQVRVAGTTKTAVCRTRTGPWIRRISAPPAPTALRITIAPRPTSLIAGTSYGFTVTQTWSDGSTTVPAVTWTAHCGSITGSGVYTPSGACPATVIATTATGLADTLNATVTAAPTGTELQIIRLMIRPSPASGLVGQSILQCPFVVFGNGAVAMRAQDRPECDAVYAGLAARAASAAQQQIADAVCLVWKVTPPGATLVVRGCDAVGS